MDDRCDECVWRDNPDWCSMAPDEEGGCPGFDGTECPECGLNPCICRDLSYEVRDR